MGFKRDPEFEIGGTVNINDNIGKDKRLMEAERREKRYAAIVLAAGKGSRMNSEIPKQFLELEGKPVIYYALKVFQESFVDEIILVVGAGQTEYCRKEITEKYNLTKVKHIIPGGQERFDSVFRGIQATGACDYVYIHDGARPFIDQALLLRAKNCVEVSGACAAGMPVKDTIKVVDGNNIVTSTPNRSCLWQIQTPQVFSFPVIRQAYEQMFASGDYSGITDDAMVVERFLSLPVRLYEGSYRNLKVTTPEDLLIAKMLVKKEN